MPGELRRLPASMPTGPALERAVESGSAGEVGGCSERRDPALILAHYRGCCEDRCSTGYPEGRTSTNSPAWCPPDLLETLVFWHRALWVNQEGIRDCSDPTLVLQGRRKLASREMCHFSPATGPLRLSEGQGRSKMLNRRTGH